MKKITSYTFIHKLIKLPFIEAIWLYGSRARGDQQTLSDIDLAIVCPEASEEQWLEVINIIEKADTLLKIDCVRFDTLLKEEKLRNAILQDKIIIFDRKLHMQPWYETFLSLGEALDRLEEMVHEPENRTNYVQDATIKRFEFCVELFWKVLRKICESEGYEVNSPRNTLQTAYAMKLIEDENVWLRMMADRNLTSHTYREALADQIYHRAKEYFPTMKDTYLKLSEQYFPQS